MPDITNAKINREQEEILFLDGVHPDHQTQATYGWIQTGVQIAIKTTAKQPRIHYLGAIAVKEDKIEHITQSYDKINGEAVVNFLAKIANKLSHKKKIHIILDNAGYHKCKEVKEYLEQHPKIQLHYLPPYSPNLKKGKSPPLVRGSSLLFLPLSTMSFWVAY